MKVNTKSEKPLIKITVTIEASENELQNMRVDFRNIVCDDITTDSVSDDVLIAIIDAIDDMKI